MAKTLFSISVILFFFISGLYAVEIVISARAEEDKIGYELLDRFIGMFQEMAAKGTGGRDKVDRALQDMMEDTKSTFAEKQLDPVFFHRFNRILMMTKLTIVEDEQGIFGPLIQQEVGSFVKDVTGIEADVTGKKTIGIVANSLAQGLLDLHIYLDTKKHRAKLMKEWEEWDKKETKSECKTKNKQE